jgi:mono/diheme cytochrome c family protein
MCNWRDAIASLLLGSAVTLALAQSAAYVGIGRVATPAELAAWDTDVRPDFKGLPKGSGTVAQGQQIWEDQCASCHGMFGESNQVFQPIVGGTGANDVQRGRSARLTDPSFPGRTTLMKRKTRRSDKRQHSKSECLRKHKTQMRVDTFSLLIFEFHMGDASAASSRFRAASAHGPD